MNTQGNQFKCKWEMHPYLWVEETEFFCTAAGSLGPVFHWCIHGFLHWKGKEVIAGRYFKWNIKCAVTLLLPNSPRFSCQISPWLEKRVSSEVSLHHAAAGLFVWLTIFKNYIFFFFFFLWNMFTVYLALLPLALVLNGTWPSRTVASLDVYIRNQRLFH